MEGKTLKAELGGRTFRETINDREAELMRLALKEAQDTGEGVSRASRLLGFKHHQSLIALLSCPRHKGIAKEFGIVPRKRMKPQITRGSKHKSMNRGDWEKPIPGATQS